MSTERDDNKMVTLAFAHDSRQSATVVLDDRMRRLFTVDDAALDRMAAMIAVNPPAAPASLDVIAALRTALQAVMDHDQALDDPNGDGSGDNAQSPTGDDYNEVCSLLQPLYDALGMIGPCSPWQARRAATAQGKAG